MKGSNWEEEKEESSRKGMRRMPKSPFHHESDEFVDLDELLRETLPQVGEAVKLIERQKEADQISSDEAQEGQIKKRMEKANRKKKKKIQNEADQILSEGVLQGQKKKIMEKENKKKKRKTRVSTPSPSQRNEFESDLKKEHMLEIMGVRVSDNYNGTQEPSAPHHTKASSDEAQDSADKHAKKKRKMGTKDFIQRKRSELGFDSGKKRKMGTDLERKRSELGFDLVSGEDSNEVLAGDNSPTTLSNGNQTKFLTLKEAWELRLQYLVMETGLQMLTFMKDLYIDTMRSLKETIKQTHG